MNEPTNAQLTDLQAQLARYSSELEQLSQRLSADGSNRKLEAEMARIRAARDEAVSRLEAAPLSEDEGAAEGLRLLVEDLREQLKKLAASFT